MKYNSKNLYYYDFDFVNRAGKYIFTNPLHIGRPAFRTGHKNLNYSLRIMLKNKKSYFKPDFKKGYDVKYIFIGGKKYRLK